MGQLTGLLNFRNYCFFSSDLKEWIFLIDKTFLLLTTKHVNLPAFFSFKICCFFSRPKANFSIFFSIRQLMILTGRARSSGMNLIFYIQKNMFDNGRINNSMFDNSMLNTSMFSNRVFDDNIFENR